MQHERIGPRRRHFIRTVRLDLIVVFGDSVGETGGTGVDFRDCVDEVRRVADAVVEALAAVYERGMLVWFRKSAWGEGGCVRGGNGCAASPARVALPS